MLKQTTKRAFMELGKQYEILVWERARLKNVQAQRDVLKLGTPYPTEYAQRLEVQINKLAQVLEGLAQLKELCD